MELKETNAVLLKKTDIKEYDMLYTFYTEDFGKVKLYKKSAKGKNNRPQLGIEPYNILKVRFQPRDRELLFLGDFSIEESYHELTYSYEKYLLYSLIIEVTEKLTADRDPNAQIYRFLARSLAFIRQWDQDTGILLLFILIKLAQLFGISPRMEECISCRDEPGDDCYFSLEGGICCSRCCKPYAEDRFFRIEPEQRYFIHKIKLSRFSDLQNIEYDSVYITKLIEIMALYIKYHFNIRIRSLGLIADILKLNLF